jgi:hypothetical protein
MVAEGKPNRAERRRATEEAKGNRRFARADKTARRIERENREKKAVIRLSTRALRHGFAFSLLQLDHRYWCLKSCGWDILTKEYARDDDGQPCLPENTPIWRWWVSMHWRDRDAIRKASIFSRRHA